MGVPPPISKADAVSAVTDGGPHLASTLYFPDPSPLKREVKAFMARKKSTETRIKEEEQRILKIFDGVSDKCKETVSGLAKRAAFMVVSLEDLEKDLAEKGFTEMFSQGDQEPYPRERPAYKVYCNMNSNYQKVIKQLTDLLPPEDSGGRGGGDSFENF